MRLASTYYVVKKIYVGILRNNKIYKKNYHILFLKNSLFFKSQELMVRRNAIFSQFFLGYDKGAKLIISFSKTSSATKVGRND